MPIYAPALPPRPALDQGLPPALVIARFDFRRLRKQKLGLFFGFLFTALLLIQVLSIYMRYFLNTSQSLMELRDFANRVLTQGGEFHSGLLTMGGWLTMLLWFQVALVGGGLVARDTLYRIRPLMYAHPVRALDYLAAKGLFAAGLPFFIQLPFALLPWAMSITIAGTHGPVWISAPLRLLPAALLVSLLMGAITLGASSLASSPKAGFGWVLGIILGCGVPRLLASALGVWAEPGNPLACLDPLKLSMAWPDLCCGVPEASLGWVAASLGTALHVILWTSLALKRTQPSEVVL